jgi:hypothetical protein
MSDWRRLRAAFGFVWWGWRHATSRGAQVGGWLLVNLIPLRLQRREGLGFFASVNLGLDTRMILTLSVEVGKLVRPHGVSLLEEIIPRITLALENGSVNEDKTSIFLTIQDYLLWFCEQYLPYMKDNHHGSLFDEMSALSPGLLSCRAAHSFGPGSR